MFISKEYLSKLTVLSLLTFNCVTNTMEKSAPCQLQLHTHSRPTIQAIVYLEPLRCKYATPNQLAYLKEKGISTPCQPILRIVSKVEVIEPNKRITNWREDIPSSVKKYEEAELKKQQLSFAQNIQKRSAILRKTFPHSLPAELAFKCTNGSKISLTIEQFPVYITFASEKNFYNEQQECLSHFFEHPACSLSKNEKETLVTCGMLIKTEIPQTIRAHNHLIDQHYNTNIITINYNHGPNGSCPNNDVFKQSIIDQKLPPFKNQVKSIMNRQLTGSFK